MVGGHQRSPHVSPPCSPAPWPRSCVRGLAQAPGLCKLPIRPWAPLQACGWRPTAPGSGRCALEVHASLLRFPAWPWLPSSAEGQTCCPFGRSVVWLRAMPPPPPALGTHSIPGRPPGLLTGTAHRPLPGGLHSFLPGLLPCQAGLAAPSRCSPLCLEERKSGPRLCPGVQAGPVLTTVASGWLLPGDALRVSASESYTV